MSSKLGQIHQFVPAEQTDDVIFPLAGRSGVFVGPNPTLISAKHLV